MCEDATASAPTFLKHSANCKAQPAPFSQSPTHLGHSAKRRPCRCCAPPSTSRAWRSCQGLSLPSGGWRALGAVLSPSSSLQAPWVECRNEVKMRGVRRALLPCMSTLPLHCHGPHLKVVYVRLLTHSSSCSVIPNCRSSASDVPVTLPPAPPCAAKLLRRACTFEASSTAFSANA